MVSKSLTKPIRLGKIAHMKIDDSELADLFLALRGAGIYGPKPLLTYRQIAEITGIHHETWRTIEQRKVAEPGPEFLSAAVKSPFAEQLQITHKTLVDALKRDRDRLFAARYETEESDPRTPKTGRALGKTTA